MGCWFLKNSKPFTVLCLVLTNACLEPPLPKGGHPSPASCWGSLAVALVLASGARAGMGTPQAQALACV